LPSALRLSVRRKACHKRNKRKQGKREDPLADMWSTRRRECVGTHFACGCFKQWGSGFFSDPRKCVTTEEKSSRKATKLDARQRIAVDSILNSYRDPPKQKLLGRKMLHRKVFRHTWDAEKM
jgi:hypothetical protein